MVWRLIKTFKLPDRKDSSIRSDHLLWLNDLDDNEKWSEEDVGFLRELVKEVKKIQTELNESCQFDSHESQVLCVASRGPHW